ncbi:hypothetical protein [Bacillus sp. T33-2]
MLFKTWKSLFQIHKVKRCKRKDLNATYTER